MKRIYAVIIAAYFCSQLVSPSLWDESASYVSPTPKDDLKILTHVHSTLSDGIGTVEEMVARAAGNEFDAIIFTDHNSSFQPIRTEEELALEQKYNIIIIFGREEFIGNVHYLKLPFPGKYGYYTILAHPHLISDDSPARSFDAVETDGKVESEERYAGYPHFDSADAHDPYDIGWLWHMSYVDAKNRTEAALIQGIQEGKVWY